MAKEIFMPKLSSTMQVGTLLQWFKEEGENVDVGDPLFEIMTDKINIEVEAYEEGTLIKRYYHEDDEIPVNHVVGYIGILGENVPDMPPGESDGTTELTIKQAEIHEEQHVGKVRATPAARKMARQNGVSLFQITGSGPNGRVHRGDIIKHLQGLPNEAPLAEKIDNHSVVEQILAKKAPINANEQNKVIKMEGIRKIVANRMVESALTAPHVTLTSEVDMSESIKLRGKLLETIEKQTGFRLSYTEIIIKAVTHTLRKHPMINASLHGDLIEFHNEINIGIAVALENGLLVPVIKQADALGLALLTQECKTLSHDARKGKLKPDSMFGGTFTISNLGMYAIDAFTPIINQPESAILGVGRIHEKPVGVSGSIELRPMMHVSLSFDHRVIDGAPAAAFLTDLKEVLENPFQLLV